MAYAQREELRQEREEFEREQRKAAAERTELKSELEAAKRARTEDRARMASRRRHHEHLLRAWHAWASWQQAALVRTRRVAHLRGPRTAARALARWRAVHRAARISSAARTRADQRARAELRAAEEAKRKAALEKRHEQLQEQLAALERTLDEEREEHAQTRRMLRTMAVFRGGGEADSASPLTAERGPRARTRAPRLAAALRDLRKPTAETLESHSTV